MAFIVSTKRGTFEIRESRTTSRGPRAKTLVSFTELTDEAIAKAQRKARKPLDAEEMRRAARRVGAPIAGRPVDRAARQLIAELARGTEPAPKLRRLLVDALGGGWSEPATSPASSRSAAEWIAATPEQRGKTLEDLLLLADALPHAGRRGQPLRFPSLGSAHA
jgi:hypothetical protein